MAKSKKKPEPAEEPTGGKSKGGNLRARIIEVAASAGLSRNDFRAPTKAQKIGDGVLLGKFLELLKGLLPILLPIFLTEPKAKAATAEDAEDELTQEVRNAAAQCGLSEQEMHATASGLGWGATLAKWFKFFNLILPFIIPILDGTEEEGESKASGDTDESGDSGG